MKTKLPNENKQEKLCGRKGEVRLYNMILPPFMPQKILSDRLLAMCLERKAPRTFLLERILNIRPHIKQN